jgi:hypothetical protein
VRDDDVQSLHYFAIPNVDISHACFSPTPGCNNVVVETMLQSTSGKLTLNMIGERRFPWSKAVFTAHLCIASTQNQWHSHYRHMIDVRSL